MGKRLLTRSLASLTRTSFLNVAIPRLVLEVIHRGGKVGELVTEWSNTLGRCRRSRSFFNELEFSQAEELGARRPDLPVGPVMDFLLDMMDRTIAHDHHQVVGSTSHPDTLRHAFAQPGRFERVVEVNADLPRRHRRDPADPRRERPRSWPAGRYFDEVDWERVVAGASNTPRPGDWVHILHAVLRRKARYEAAGESVSLP